MSYSPISFFDHVFSLLFTYKSINSGDIIGCWFTVQTNTYPYLTIGDLILVVVADVIKMLASTYEYSAGLT